MIPARGIDLYGSIETSDANGHCAVLNFEGNRITVILDSVRSALAARRAARSAFPGADVLSAGPLPWWSVLGNWAQDVEVQVCIREHKIGAIGTGVRPNWLGTRLAGFPANMNVRSMLSVLLSAF